MASAQSLLGLMNQLQSLESNVASILLETSLKLCSLTDINIFFLVETAEGRRFAGNPQLCDAFRRGGLIAADSDVECVVNPTVSALEEKAPEASRGSSASTTTFGRNNGFHHHLHASPVIHSNRKRNLPFDGVPARLPKTFKPDAGDDNVDPNASSSKVEDVDVHNDPDGAISGGDLELDLFDTVGENDDDDSPIVDAKDEVDHGSPSEVAHNDVSVVGAAAGVDDDFCQFDLTDDDIVEVPLSDRGSSSRVSGAAFSNSPAGNPFKNWQSPSGASSISSLRQMARQRTDPGPPVMDFMNDIYPQSLMDKLNALEPYGIEDIFDASAAPRKVLNSVLHEVGTKLAFSCPHWPRHLSNPRLKEWLNSNLEVFIVKFPVMRRICDDRKKVYIGKRAMSTTTYVKNNIRSSYDKQFKSNGKESANDYGQLMLA